MQEEKNLQENNLKPEDDSYYDKNKSKIKIQQRIYYQSHKKKLNESAKTYYSENREKVLGQNKVSVRKKNYDKQYYLKNKVEIQQRRKYLYQQQKLREQLKKEVNS